MRHQPWQRLRECKVRDALRGYVRHVHRQVVVCDSQSFGHAGSEGDRAGRSPPGRRNIAEAGAGNTAPIYKHRPMHMAKDNVTDRAVTLQNGAERFGIGQLDRVQFWIADVAGGMVHEQSHRHVTRIRQLPVQPVEPLWT